MLTIVESLPHPQTVLGQPVHNSHYQCILTISSLNLPVSSSSTTSRELLSQFSTCSWWSWLEVDGKWKKILILLKQFNFEPLGCRELNNIFFKVAIIMLWYIVRFKGLALHVQGVCWKWGWPRSSHSYLTIYRRIKVRRSGSTSMRKNRVQGHIPSLIITSIMYKTSS